MNLRILVGGICFWIICSHLYGNQNRRCEHTRIKIEAVKSGEQAFMLLADIAMQTPTIERIVGVFNPLAESDIRGKFNFGIYRAQLSDGSFAALKLQRASNFTGTDGRS